MVLRRLHVGGLAFVLVTAAALAAAAPAQAAEPDYQLPFPCGETWTGQTRSGHGNFGGAGVAVDFNWGVGSDDLGKPVVAAASGTFQTYWDANGAGNGAYIQHGDGYRSWYSHLRAYAVDDNAPVVQGQVIGFVGSTGSSTGPHLHYEVDRNNVGQYIRFNGTLYNQTGPITSLNGCAPDPDPEPEPVPPPPPVDTLDRNLRGGENWDDLAFLSDGDALYTAGGAGDGTFYTREMVSVANPLPDGFAGITDVAIGQVTNDNNQDLVLKHEDGTIYRMAGTGQGAYSSPVRIAEGWQNIAQFAVGDVTGDGKDDLVGTSASGTLYRAMRDLPTGDGLQFFSKVEFGSDWADMEDLAVADVTGEGKDEIIGLNSETGKVYVAEFEAPSEYGTRRSIVSSGWEGVEQLAVGDFNGDLQADFVGIKGSRLYRQIAKTNVDEEFFSLTPTEGGVSDWGLIRDLG